MGVGAGAFGEQQVEDVVGGAVSEKLAKGLFVPGDAVLFDEGEEVLRGEAGERGLCEVKIGGEEVFRAGVEVGEVATASPGDEDLLAGTVGVLEDESAATAAAGLDGAHKARGAGTEDEDVDFSHRVSIVSEEVDVATKVCAYDSYSQRGRRMKIDTKDFLIRPGKKVKLQDWPTKVKPVYGSKEEYKELLEKHVSQLSSMQELLYGANQHALLLIFQGMDAAGKDGAIRHVMSGVNPQGCEVASFKQPSAEELEHDFLWRAEQKLPGRGRIGIFNRSYYEEVLVVRVHPEDLAGEGLAGQVRDKKVWEHRYQSIVDMEKHLDRNGTRIVKIFLHLSKEEQRRRFLARIDEPDKNWKFSLADVHERKYWKDYVSAFEECLQATSTSHAPWYAVPADDKENARLIVSQIVLDALGELKMSYPKTTAKRRTELLAIRKALVK